MHFGVEKLSTAAPIHNARMRELLDRCTEAGIQLRITNVYRSNEEQFDLYMKGRSYDKASGSFIVTNTNLIVTKALPGTSAHNVVDSTYLTPASLASDIIPTDSKGNPIWDTPDSVWLKIYDICNKKIGLDAYGDPWGRLYSADKGHVEEPMWNIILGSLNLKVPEFNIMKRMNELSKNI